MHYAEHHKRDLEVDMGLMIAKANRLFLYIKTMFRESAPNWFGAGYAYCGMKPEKDLIRFAYSMSQSIDPHYP